MSGRDNDDPPPPLNGDPTRRARRRTFKPRRRRLSSARQHRFDTLAPRFKIDDAVSAATARGEFLAWQSLFPSSGPVVLDVGIGSGESCVEMATADPATNIVGVDVHTPGVANAVIAAADRGLANLLVYEGDVYDMLVAVPRHTVAGIRVFFPDPWPKARHTARRMIGPGNVEPLIAALAPRGWLHLATDDSAYADQMQRVCNAVPTLRGGVIDRPADRPLTRFEQRGRDAGRTITDLWYQVVS